MALESVAAAASTVFVAVGLLILARHYTVRIMMAIIPQKIFARFSVSMPQVESFVTALRENELANVPLGAASYC